MSHEISEQILKQVRDMFPPDRNLQPIRAIVIMEAQEFDENGSMAHRIMLARSDSAQSWNMLGMLAYAEMEGKMEMSAAIAHARHHHDDDVDPLGYIEYEEDDDDDA